MRPQEAPKVFALIWLSRLGVIINKIERMIRYEKYSYDYLKQKEEGDYTLALLLDGG